MYVLAGDLGGTKTLLRIAEVRAGRQRVVCEERYASSAFAGLPAMIRAFLAVDRRQHDYEIAAACLGVAGPVRDTGGAQRATLTNLPWTADSAEIADTLGVNRVRLINDFQAVGYGIETLAPRDLASLQAGVPVMHAPRVTIGAGTGLGQGLLVWRDHFYEALPTEGGHAGFAPADGLQADLLAYLRDTFGRVSCERLLSGAGITSICRFLRARGDHPAASDAVLRADDPAAAITHAALTQADPLAVQTLDLFISIYGAHAGDLALTALAAGGVYVAGGIAPRIISRLRMGGFIQAFNAKGRMSDLARTIPVHVVMNPEVGVMGAAHMAARMAGS